MFTNENEWCIVKTDVIKRKHERRNGMTYKEARESAGIVSSTMMAKLMGMNKMTYNLKENYQRHFKDYEFIKFCQLTGVKPSQLDVLRG